MSSETDVGVIEYVLSVVETGNVVSFVEMRICGLSIEGKVKCIYVEGRMKKDREQEGKGIEHEGRRMGATWLGDQGLLSDRVDARSAEAG